ncbi:Protein cgi121 [Moelleriella libera RCEF 2490]|uniref:EKC/KEOPS complex subunit CGI121 n=1 Tax=Moelleriella libera RCEF 2490 TaxID=1081109 RepID=A0A167XN81_9HYPO|nr:Protein cgi121 [Moelleriella libera RCEF 2490]
MSLELVPIEHVPSSYSVFVAAYREVQNAAFLHQQLLNRNADFEYAFIDAAAVYSRRQLLSAVFKAITAADSDTLKTPNIHSEIVISLNLSNNISESYRRFGISPDTKDLIAVKISFSSRTIPGLSRDEISNHLESNIRGIQVSITDESLAVMTDIARVRKYYKLNGLGWLEAIEDDFTKHAELDLLVTSSVALRGT